MAHHNNIGKSGEQLAKEYLTARGYAIRDQNWRSGKYELDIVAMDGLQLVVVEVKTRSTHEYGDPEDFIKPSKIRNIVNAADCYLQKLGHPLEVRFDVISVILNHEESDDYTIEHIKDAFMPGIQNTRSYGF